MALTPQQEHTLGDINIAVSVFSFLGALFIVLCWVSLKSLRKYTFRLVVYVSICDLFYAIGNMMGDDLPHGACIFQA